MWVWSSHWINWAFICFLCLFQFLLLILSNLGVISFWFFGVTMGSMWGLRTVLGSPITFVFWALLYHVVLSLWLLLGCDNSKSWELKQIRLSLRFKWKLWLVEVEIKLRCDWGLVSYFQFFWVIFLKYELNIF